MLIYLAKKLLYPIINISMFKFLPALFCCLFFLPASTFAQTSTRNFVRETVYKKNGGSLSNPTETQSTITYLDGLGRPVQTVAVHQGGNGEDIVSHISYDEFGRDNLKYAPYPIAGSNGAFRPLAPAEASSNLGGDAKPYSLSVYEPSPLNRILKQGGPGDAWGVSPDAAQLGDHSVKIKYATNGANEVKRFDALNADGKKINGSWDIGGGLAFVGYYDKNQLWVTETFDENNTTQSGGNRTKEYKDKSGRVVLKKAYLSDGTTFDTYYVYDDFGQLRAVFPPLLSGNLINIGAELKDGDLTNIKELAFLYCYDNEGRMVKKKVPGADYVELTYNTTTDLLISTQDGNQRAAGVSSYMTYDALNRVVETGVGSNWLTKTYYDGTNAGWDDAINKKSDYPLDNTAKIGMVTGGETRTINADGTYGASLPSRIYYDSRYRVVKTYKGYDNLLTGSTAEEVTMKRSYIGTVLEEKTVQYNGLDYLTILKNFQYDHAERLLSICHRITETASMKTREEVPHLLNWLTYDGLGRLERKSMGKLPLKFLKKNPTLEFAETQYYKYNIRNWLSKSDGYRLIPKNSYASPPGDDKHNFNINLSYTDAKIAQYNGNIGDYTWQGGGYNLEYDGLNRLMKANGGLGAYFEEELTYDKNGNIKTLKRHRSSDPTGTDIDDLTYTYGNGGKSNQLIEVSDATNNTAGYKNTFTGTDFVYDANGNLTKDEDKKIGTINYNVLNLVRQVQGNGLTQSYVWDAAGSKLKYNSTNVNKVYIGAVEYATSANSGLAPSRIGTEEGHIMKRDNWTENSTLSKYVYYYHVKDHLGNIRVVIDDEQDAQVYQNNSYSPFGLTVFGAGPGLSVPDAKKYNDRYYNGKEEQDVVGWYDFGARMYNAELGRWMCIDPMAEKYLNLSCYGFNNNNPIRFIDLDGRQFDDANEKKAQKMDKKIDKQIANLNKEIAKLLKKGLSVGDRNDRISQMNKSKTDISDMRSDKNNFYKFEKSSKNNGLPETKRTGSNEVTMFTDDFSKQIHEGRHGGQIARGEFNIDMSGAVISGIAGASKEIDAYRAQYSFDGKIDYVPEINLGTDLLKFMTQGVSGFKQTITSMGQITNTFLQSMVDKPGINQTKTYPSITANPSYYQQ
jgi:RHS repeat-associated protein